MDCEFWVPYSILMAVMFILALYYYLAAADEECYDSGEEEFWAARLTFYSNYLQAQKEERLVYATEDGDGGCAICLDEYSAGEPRAIIDACGHRYHGPCIEAWLLDNHTCPLCRHLLV